MATQLQPSPLHRHWTHRAAAGFTAAIFAAVVLGALGPSPAAGAVVKEIIEFSDHEVPNDCTGEIITEEGQITTWVRVTEVPSGGLMLRFHYQFRAVGIGDFGNLYIINQQAQERILFLPSGGLVVSQTDQFVQISKGSDPNTRFKFTYQLLVGPDGTVRFFVERSWFDCLGPDGTDATDETDATVEPVEPADG